MQSVESPAPPLSCVVRGSGPGVLLAHGGGGTVQSTFGALIGPLSADYRVIAPDCPGSGRTPRASGPLELDRLADEQVAAAVAAGQETFAIVGHSLGSAIAVRAATRHPERVTALVLTAGFARPDVSTRLKVRMWLSLLEAKSDILPRYLMSVMLSERYLNAMTEAQLDGFAELVGSTLPDGTPEQIELVLKLDVRADLPRLAVPTLVVATTADQMIPPRLSGDLADRIPGARLVELDCGHQPGLECAPEWRRAIQEFLGPVLRGARR